MNKSTYLVVGLVVVLVAGSLYVLSPKRDTAPAPTTITEPTSDETADTQNGKRVMTTESDNVRYIPYSENAFNAITDKRRVLFFYASWCPTCRPADAEFSEKMSQIPEDVQILRVNYDDPDTDEDEVALAEKYNITYQHTYVQIDSLGKQVAKWNGGALNELLANIK